MTRRFQICIPVMLALWLLLLSSRYSMAQDDSRTMGSYRVSSQNFTPTPYVPPSANYQPYNGYPLSHYYFSPNWGLPTYMTSINYPWTYGAYTYPYAPGINQPGLQRGQFTTGPNIYNIYATPGSAFGPGENVLNTAMRPLQTTAYVNVWVPSGAELRFEGMPTEPRGSFRHFVTPPLIPGREYTYDISATWTEYGQQVSKTRHVAIHAGDRLYVDFRMPEATEMGASALRTKPLP
jgi:uncharacterized protein (TIGR03000 family)